jgi:hypothetical protein
MKKLIEKIEKIKVELEKLSLEKFTGEVVWRLSFNQGGVRDTKVSVEKNII